jgi:hypothetical protein
MALDFTGIFTPQNLATYTYQQIRWIITQFWVNQYPIVARTPRRSVTGATIETRRRKYRPRNYVIGTGGLNNTDVDSVLVIADVTSRNDSVTFPGGFGDTSTLMAGDILNVDSERIEVIATPNTDVGAQPGLAVFGTGLAIPAAGHVLVRRGAEGTTVATHTATTNARLIGNSRTGGEVNQNGYYATPIKANQYVQTWEFPVQIGGGVEAEKPYGMQEPGSPFETDTKQKLDDMLRDMEDSAIEGIGEAYSNTNPRQKQIGLKNLVVTNRVTSPTGASAYTPENFEADVMQALFLFGSVPDIIFCASDFMRGVTRWSYNMERIDAGQTVFGVNIKTYTSNLCPGAMIIPDPSMQPGEIFVGMSEYLWWGEQQPEYFKPRGSRGDAMEGDWLSRGCIMLDDEQKHVYLSGITGYAAA